MVNIWEWTQRKRTLEKIGEAITDKYTGQILDKDTPIVELTPNDYTQLYAIQGKIDSLHKELGIENIYEPLGEKVLLFRTYWGNKRFTTKY